ncbi:MAG: hypothetical protein U1D55_13290 [Phycisphaerae bacterium]
MSVRVRLAAVVCLLCVGGAYLSWRVVRPAGAVAFPSRSGSYSFGAWRYDYLVTATGTRSERRIGRLFERGRELAGSPGDVRDTPLGRFAYFGVGDTRYNIGWLNTLTYDMPVFDSDGRLLPEVASGLLNARDAP